MNNNQYNNNIMETPIYSGTQVKGQNYLYNPNYTPQKIDLFSPNNNNLNNMFLRSNRIDTSLSLSPLSLSTNFSRSPYIKNTSLLCVLKILYYCFKDKIEGIIYQIGYLSEKNQDNNFTKTILNIINFMKNEPKDNNDILYLNTNIQIFRQQIATIISKFNGVQEISPFDVYHEIYITLCNESRKYNSYFEDSKLKNINNIPGLESFSSIIIQKLNNIALTLHNPLYDYFHFILIETIKCPCCKLIYNVNIKDLCYLEFDASISGDTSNLIHNYFNKNEVFFNSCTKCLINAQPIKNIYFLTKPKYLVFYFNGKNMLEKNLDDKIDLTKYSYPSMDNNEPNIYTLFAVVKRDNTADRNYCAFIKEQNDWYFYNAKQIKKCDMVFFECIFPYIVIYKGENLKN